MNETDQQYAARLMKATDEILQATDPKTIKGAINWGDLGCSLVERVEMFDGSPQIERAWRVVVEEASPDSHELAAYVHNLLSSLGFKDVEVQCDW